MTVVGICLFYENYEVNNLADVYSIQMVKMKNYSGVMKLYWNIIIYWHYTHTHTRKLLAMFTIASKHLCAQHVIFFKACNFFLTALNGMTSNTLQPGVDFHLGEALPDTNMSQMSHKETDTRPISQ